MRGIRAGFSLIELVIIILLLGMIARMVIPNVSHYLPGYRRQEFIARLNGLVNLAWQNALIEQRLHRIFFDLEKRIVRVEIEKKAAEGDTKKKFDPVTINYISSNYQWPENFHIKQMYVDNVDIANQPGLKMQTIWFYVSPEGLIQPTIINVVDDSARDADNNEVQIGLVINPFTGQMKVHEKFAKP